MAVTRRAALVLGLTLGAVTLTACGRIAGSRLNPLNWFGRSRRVERAAPAPAAAPADPRQLAGDIIDVTIERMPGGAILRATAVPPTQGFWDAELVPVPPAADAAEGAITTLVFDFRVAPPPTPKPAVTPRSRQITAAVFLTNRQLETVRSITVQGATSGRSIRR